MSEYWYINQNSDHKIDNEISKIRIRGFKRITFLLLQVQQGGKKPTEARKNGDIIIFRVSQIQWIF